MAGTEKTSELNKLEEYLKLNGFNYKRIEEEYIVDDEKVVGEKLDLSRHQVVVKDENGKYLWDAICHFGSYGYDDGLLEIMGSIVRDDAKYAVEGWLTAEDVISRLKPKTESEHEFAFELRVGDGVTTDGVDGIVVREPYPVGSEGELFVSVWYGQHMASKALKNVIPTGKHYPQIVEVLEQLKGEADK